MKNTMTINRTATVVVYKGSVYQRVDVTDQAAPNWFLMNVGNDAVIRQVQFEEYVELEDAYRAMFGEALEGVKEEKNNHVDRLINDFQGWMKEDTKEIG